MHIASNFNKCASLGRQYEDDKRMSVEQPARPESGLPRRGGLAVRLGDIFRRGIWRLFHRSTGDCNGRND